MRLNQNINSLNVYRNYSRNLIENSTALNRISSGKKINGAKDNPNKVSQSETMRIRIKSLQMAQKNIQDTSSMLQAVDGALNSIGNTLIQIKELTVRAATDTLIPEDKQKVQNEIDSLKKGIEELVETSEFNGIKLINDGSVNNNRHPKHINGLIGADKGETIQIPTFNANPNHIKDENGNKLSDISVMTRENANKAITTVESAISQIANMRSVYGAMDSRLNDTSNSLNQIEGTTQRAQSKITDANIAMEMAEYSRTDLLINASISLLHQTNNLPQDALKILERVR